MRLETVRVSRHDERHGGYRTLAMRSRLIAPDVRPGMFVHLRVPRLDAAVLRRPFSVFDAGPDELAILYKRVGRGTEAMAALRPGDEVSLIGPLGNGFPAPADGTVAVLVAGGYGVAPLRLLARRMPRAGHVFIGGRSRDDILCGGDFEALGWAVHVATEDGSLGTRGLVTDALEAWLEHHAGPPPEFFACGPDGMTRAVARRAIAGNWRAWLSLDRRMGCGVGACLACVVKLTAPEGAWRWARVCRDGPVFEARQIFWDAVDGQGENAGPRDGTHGQTA